MSDPLTSVLSERKKEKPRLYNEMTNELKAARISNDIKLKQELLAKVDKTKKVTFSDVNDVKSRVNCYLSACQKAAVIPTMSGLALSFGTSRQAIYKYCKEHEGSETAEYLTTIRELLADCLVSAGLSKCADAAVSIFVLKNHHNYFDKLEIEPILAQNGPLGPVVGEKELEERLQSLPD